MVKAQRKNKIQPMKRNKGFSENLIIKQKNFLKNGRRNL